MFCESKNNCIKLKTFFYMHRILIMSNVCLRFEYIYATFSNFRGLMPENAPRPLSHPPTPLFSLFHDFLPPIANILFFAKMGIVWMYAFDSKYMFIRKIYPHCRCTQRYTHTVDYPTLCENLRWTLNGTVHSRGFVDCSDNPWYKCTLSNCQHL